MAEATIFSKMSQIFYGDDTNEAPDPDLILFEDQLLLGLNKFKGLYTQSVQDGPNGEPGEVRLLIPEVLHRHKNLIVYVGEGSVEKKMLSQKSLYVTEKITGRTLHRLAKTVLKNCKKMLAIVKSKHSPYKVGMFPSGTNWEDYILWCLIEMKKECDREEGARIEAMLKNNNKKSAGAAKATITDGALGNVLTDSNKDNAAAAPGAGNKSNVDAGSGCCERGVEVHGTRGGGGPLSADDEDRYPDKTFFKCGVGFLAWALWGYIPFLDSAGMQTDFFSDAKKNASFGRKTESRAAIRKLAIQQNSADVDNRRGRTKRRANEEEDASTLTPTPAFDSSKILSRTLQYMAEESLENKRQKLAEMGMRQIRDKLVAQRRKEDAILQLFDRLSRNKKKPDQAMLDKHTGIENEIAALERKLDEMQDEECRRHSDTINQRSIEFIASSSSEDTATIIRRTDSSITTSNNGLDSAVDKSPIEVDDDDEFDMEENDDDDDDDAQQVRTNNNAKDKNSGCIECNFPSNHACRKCKKCVCSLCCGGNRELENAWWCGLCFATQTVANQELIRDGLYSSDVDDD